MEEEQEPTPAGAQSPLFEPEGSPPPPYQQPSVPVADMAAPDPPPIRQSEQQAEHPVNRFIEKLRELEATAKEEMADWDPVFLGQVFEDAATQAAAGIKRKGMCTFIVNEHC
jgi:hypothetical protein